MEFEGEFSDLNLNSWLLNHLNRLGFKRPTPIQYNCIPTILQGNDCIGCSKTGSGKTAAFVLPILQKLAEDPFGIFCLVLSPTRELAFQIGNQFALLGKPMNLRHAVVVGGMSFLEQARLLEKKPHVVIATPGRLADQIRSNNVKLNKVRILVFDEADRLLDKMDGDFKEDLNQIFDALPTKRQTLLFSATLSDTIKQVQELAARKPFVWQAKNEVLTVEQLDQQYLMVPEHVRDGYLVYICNELLEKDSKHTIMIFTKTRKACEMLGILLRKSGMKCVVLHSAMRQYQRLNALHRFKSSNIKLLVATDLAARGLDIPDVQVVINHNIPGLAKNYVHRVGRTARAGRSGLAISLGTQFDIDRLRSIEAHINKMLMRYDVDESSVLKILYKVNILKREAELIMERNEFGSRKKLNKRKELILKGKDPDEVEKAEKKKKVQKIRDEQLARKRKRRLYEVELASAQAKRDVDADKAEKMEEKKKVQKISDEQLARKRKRRLLEVERASGQAKCNIDADKVEKLKKKKKVQKMRDEKLSRKRKRRLLELDLASGH